MTYEEFEWHILRLVYEGGVDRLQPSYLAYALGLPHETVNSYLEHAAQTGVIEMDVTDDGRLEYYIPGLDRKKPFPAPLWKEQKDGDATGSASTTASTAVAVAAPIAEENHDGTISQTSDANAMHRTPAMRCDLPPNLRAHIEQRYAGADGTVMDAPAGLKSPVFDINATAEGPATGAMVRASDHPGALMVETSDEPFCDPSQTIFMRQIRVHGVKSETMLRAHVQRLFESFGYRVVHSGDERIRFERGSVTFILALVPLFVFVLPLFVYLFLYCMGRSTIHQEPLELDVQFRKKGGDDSMYEIDLMFIGLHGVVLGAADQRVLNQEIDSLRDELHWALTS